MSLPIAVFASGGGTNLQALIDRLQASGSARVAEVALVVSDREDAGALERARQAGIPTQVIPTRSRPQEEVAGHTVEALRSAGVELVALAGYLQLLPAAVVASFRERILNVHPSLLPAFGGRGMHGLHVHRAVLDAGCTISGASVHVVDEVYDRGRILAQWPVPVLQDDTPERLAARVLRVEHWLYPDVVESAARLISRMGDLWTSQPLAEAMALPFWADADAVHVIGRAARPATFLLVPESES